MGNFALEGNTDCSRGASNRNVHTTLSSLAPSARVLLFLMRALGQLSMLPYHLRARIAAMGADTDTPREALGADTGV